MTASRYASLLFGTAEYKEIGPFRFPVYDELVPGEAKELGDLKKLQSLQSFGSLKLARTIAKDKGIKTKEAIDLLGELDSDDNQDIVFDYAEDLAVAQEKQLTDEDVVCRRATITIKHRGEAFIDGEWTKLKDWTASDTDKVPSFSMLKEISEFLETQEPKAAPEAAGTEGKSQKQK